MADPSADSPASTPPPGRAYEVLTPGEKFGDYQVMKCLSYDLMGSLYLVRKTRLKEMRSIFVLPPLVRNDTQFRERFFQSTGKLCQLEHPNILRMLDADLVKDRFTIYHEAFEGQNLADYLEQYAIDHHKAKQEQSDDLLADIATGLPEDEARNILIQLLEGLSYAHAQRVLHLNLNPTNILRDKEGNIKLAELGLMTMAGKPLFESLVSAGIPPISLGPRRIRINTVDILSPEVRLGKEGDERSDIYAFGLTAYWLLTGHKPAYHYKPPSELNPDLNKSWDTLIANCLERIPEKRYGSADAVLRDLRDLENLRARTEPLEPGTSDTKSVFRHVDFIPVPKQIRARGEKTTRAFRLGIIGAFALIFAYIATMFYGMAFGEEVADNRPIAIRTPEGKQARLAFRVEPANASVKFPAENLNFLTRNGELDLNVIPGQYRIEVSSPLHMPHRQLIDVGTERQTLDIRLEPSWANVVIRTNPGVRATAIDSQRRMYDLGVADEDGILRVAQILYTGSYTLRFEKEDYLTLEKKDFQLNDTEQVNLDFYLAPIPGTLRVRSTPKDATIYVEGRVEGVTNATVEGLPVGVEFIVTLEKPGYRTEKLAVTLQPNTRTVLDFGELTPRSGEILPQVTFNGEPATSALLAGLSYKIGDKNYPGTATVLDQVPEGEITVTVSHPDYLDVTRSFAVPDNTVLRMPVDLQPKPGRIVLQVRPLDLPVNLSANGKVFQLGKERTFTLKPAVPYELVLESPDYIPLHKTLTLQPNETFTWDAKLTPIPGPMEGEDYDLPYVDVDMAWIPAGTFTMGSPREEHARLPEEGPRTEVTISKGFWLGAKEITQEQYQQVMGNNPSEFKGEDHPVDKVTWEEAMKFCRAINVREKNAGRVPEGYAYRLPTEAEWEYAARAGSTTPFHWGDTADSSHANFKGEYPRDFTSQELDDADRYGTVAAGSFTPNAFGLYDMHGNVAEWCLDTFNGRLPGGKQTDWVRTGNGSKRVVRGGGWETFAIRSRAASRTDSLAPTTRSSSVGFRLCLGPVVDGS